MSLAKIGNLLGRNGIAFTVADRILWTVRGLQYGGQYLTVVAIKEGRVTATGKKNSQRMISELEDLCSSQGLRRGKIGIRETGQITFSGIDPAWHQRIRNIMVNR